MKSLNKLAPQAGALSALLFQATCTGTVLVGGSTQPQPSQAAEPEAVSLAIDTRSTTAVQGMQYCGNFANADGSMAVSLVTALGQGHLETREYTVAAHGCNRVQCWDTSGVYVCNDNAAAITVTGAQVSTAASSINSDCCLFSTSGSELHQSIMAGQQFTQWGWNVVVAYADCNVGVTVKPSVLGGYGVNAGACMQFSGIVV